MPADDMNLFYPHQDINTLFSIVNIKHRTVIIGQKISNSDLKLESHFPKELVLFASMKALYNYE